MRKWRYNIYVLLSIILLSLSCQDRQKNRPLKINYLNNEGIFIEQFEPEIDAKDRFILDNKVYLPSTKITFEYFIFNPSGEAYKINSPAKNRNNPRSWDLVKMDDVDSSTIQTVVLFVENNPNHILYNFPNYNQNVITYSYCNNFEKSNLSEATGVIENEKNTWIHPPRKLIFKILELNPFPFIQTPFEIGHSWKWALQIGDSYSDKRWKDWNGIINNQISYEISDTTHLITKMGTLNCYEIKATATSKLGTTQLTSYYNETFGFIKLDYLNIDSSRITLIIESFN
jgi:hypothetical protein